MNRSRAKDRLKWTLLDGTECEVGPNDFSGNAPWPIPGISRECADSVSFTDQPGSGTYSFSGIKDIQAAFYIELQCHCGIGLVNPDDLLIDIPPNLEDGACETNMKEMYFGGGFRNIGNCP